MLSKRLKTLIGESKWSVFQENVLLLIKSKYMSDKNYAYLHVAKKGGKIAWTFIVHQNITFKIKEKDKRKVDKASQS